MSMKDPLGFRFQISVIYFLGGERCDEDDGGGGSEGDYDSL